MKARPFVIAVCLCLVSVTAAYAFAPAFVLAIGGARILGVARALGPAGGWLAGFAEGALIQGGRVITTTIVRLSATSSVRATVTAPIVHSAARTTAGRFLTGSAVTNTAAYLAWATASGIFLTATGFVIMGGGDPARMCYVGTASGFVFGPCTSAFAWSFVKDNIFAPYGVTEMPVPTEIPTDRGMIYRFPHPAFGYYDAAYWDCSKFIVDGCPAPGQRPALLTDLNLPVPDEVLEEERKRAPLPVEAPRTDPIPPIETGECETLVTGTVMCTWVETYPCPECADPTDLNARTKKYPKGETPPAPAPGASAPAPPEGSQKDECDSFPDRLGCKELGEELQDTDLQKKNVTLSWNPVPWGADNAACPAPKSVTVQGKAIAIDNSLLCSFFAQSRPYVLTFAWLLAIYIVFGFKGSSSED